MTTLLGLMLAVSGLALLANGAMAATGRLKRNHYFLARDSGALKSRVGWSAALRAAGPTMCLAGVVSAGVGIAVSVLNPQESTAIMLVGGALIGTLTLATVGAIRAHRAALVASGGLARAS